VYLVDGDPDPVAVLLRRGQISFGPTDITVEVMAASRDVAEGYLAGLRERMRRRSVYRGRIVSLTASPPMGSLEVKFHRLPPVAREDIVLPQGVLERIERQTIRFAELRDVLAASRRHLKRGVLLWGPPGTGKTMTAMYVASHMPERTVFLLTGQTLGLIEQSCAMARLLAPATVILEDVDLVAEERTNQGTGTNAVLFQLLNEMDGLADDADILFLLTTNRPELLEAALAARPGRIDEAIQVPLPDGACRDRLVDLYGQGLHLQLRDRQAMIDRTEGVSASFIKELLRRSALIAADRGAQVPITVDDTHIDQALHELLVDGGDLIKSLLGVARDAPRRGDCAI
jgi:SpoVK/Ycf46/Vps4 family AAA+-type ATPase